MNVIKVDNITKTYNIRYGIASFFSDIFLSKKQKEITALNNVSFEVKKGECVGLIGPNGSGKTTLLKILTGVTKPNKGTYKIKGRIGPLIQVGAGFHPELTGRENIYLYASILGMSKKETDKKMEEIVEFSGVGDFLNTPVKKYSSGMFIRLGFSVAIHIDPDVLLIDEVLAVGDIRFQNKCIQKIQQIKRMGKGIIFVSHNIEQIRRICDKLILLLNGKIVFEGKVDDTLSKYYDYIINENVLKYLQYDKFFDNDIIIEELKVNDSKNPFISLNENENIKINMKIRDNKKRNLYIKINFVSINGIEIMEYISPLISKTDNEIIFEIDKLSIQTGIYFISISVKDETDKLLLLFNNKIVLRLRNDTIKKMFILNHRWKIN